ncbi:uncharacterized protein JCM6883_003380 [Sporobolomyces salmoneus]|uniref:uncharacterized protein n=1 Tax=Sporobolomyces salmoneus TaxID=183962 RepID=UPI00317EB9E9
MDQAGQDDFDLLFEPAITRRESSTSHYLKRLSISSESWPSTPLLPHTPTSFGFPQSSSGQSIPIFFDEDDVGLVEGERSEGGCSPQEKQNLFEGRREEPHSPTIQRPLEPRSDFEMNRLSSAYSASSASSTCLSIDSVSAASVSTAPTEPPSPSPLSTHSNDCSPPTFSIPLPLPIQPSTSTLPQLNHPHLSYPLLNARRNVGSRPGTAPSYNPRQRSFSSTPTSSVPHFAPRPQHSHHCLKRRPPRSADSTSSAPPPADAFFDPSSSSRPSTSSTFSGSVKQIPIRLVPPTPTPSDQERAVRTKPRQLHHAPSSPVLRTHFSTKESRSKQSSAPPLPIFPTRLNNQPTSRTSPPSTAPTVSHARNRSRSEGVYNVPFYPPCVYPPSPPRPSPPSPRSSPRTRLASKFSYRHLLREKEDDAYSQIESIPLIKRGTQAPTISVESEDSSSLDWDDGARFVIGESTLQLLIDQEGFRDAKIEFIYTGVDVETGLLEFVARRPDAGLEREGWPFHVGFLQCPPHLRRLHLNNNEAVDYLRREASLSIGNKDGVYKVSSHSKIDLDLAQGGHDIEGPYFSFAYETKRRLNLVGRSMKGERLLRPLVFVCSREFLDPRFGRKIGFRHLIARTFTIPTSASLVVRKQKSASALKLTAERQRERREKVKAAAAEC